MALLQVYVLLSLLLPAISSASVITTITAASLLATGYKGKIIFNGQTGFDDATKPFAFNYDKNPKVALVPNAAKDVSLAIKWMNVFNLDFATRSGGVADSQSDGVILNLANLNKVEYDSSKGVINLGPGQPWGNVYSALKDSPVTALGGRIPFVGVGGFTVGGGISYLQNAHGLASDSIVDAQVVLADGSIKWAKSDPDLMYAVKGAGYTIGAVTELVVKAYPKPTQIYGGFVAYAIDQFEVIKNNVANFTAVNTDPNLSLLLAVVGLNGAPVVLVNPIVYGSEAFAKGNLPWVWNLPNPILDTTASLTWEELQDIQLAFVHPPAANSNYQQHNVVVKHLTAEVIQTAVDWQLSLLSDARWSGIQILFEPFVPGAFSSHATAGSWPHSEQNLAIVEIFIEQTNAVAGDPEANEAKLRAGAALVEQVAGGSEVLPRYPNYYLQGSPASEYYGGNLGKLKLIKKKFDPRNRFNKKMELLSGVYVRCAILITFLN